MENGISFRVASGYLCHPPDFSTVRDPHPGTLRGHGRERTPSESHSQEAGQAASHHSPSTASQPSPWFSLRTVSPVLSIAIAGQAMGPSTPLGAPQPLGSCRQGSCPAALQMCGKVPLLEPCFSPALLLTPGGSAPLLPSAEGGCPCPSPRMRSRLLLQGKFLETQKMPSLGISEQPGGAATWFGWAEVPGSKQTRAAWIPCSSHRRQLCRPSYSPEHRHSNKENHPVPFSPPRFAAPWGQLQPCARDQLAPMGPVPPRLLEAAASLSFPSADRGC